MRRYCFLAERQVGIGSAAGAIHPYVLQHPNVVWTDVTYFKEGGWLERTPLPTRLSGVIRGYQQTTAALQQTEFDALCFLTHNPAVFQQRAVRRTPTLLWTDVTPALLDEQAEQYEHAVDDFEPVRRFKHALVHRTFHTARLCIGWSEWARKSFVRSYGVAEERTTVVHPGVDLAHFTARRDMPRGTPRLLFVGGNFARKGGDLLLEVFEQHFKGRCELDIVTRDKVEPREGVRVHHGLNAKSAELAALYEAASAFVLPTRGDCFSIASMEAMAKSLPVVVSGVGGIPEIVEQGQSGFLLGEASGTDLKNALDSLLSEPGRAAQLGARGRAIVEAKFDAKKTAANLLALADKVVDSASPASA